MSPILLILIILAAIAFLLLGAAYYLQRVALFPHRYTRTQTKDLEINAGKLISFADFESWQHSEILINSPFGYTLQGLYFPIPGSRKTMILSHGITITLMGSAKYMPIFRRLGYNILIYDNRFHGLSGGPNCSFGFYEKYDLKAVVDWAFEQIGPDGSIGTHGESLGAAITLQHAAIDPRISFAIADCAYSDLWQLFTIRLANDYHLPVFPILHIASWMSRRMAGFDFKKVSPVRDMQRTSPPILFIHGEKDTYIPPQMSRAMAEAKKTGISGLYIVPGAKHAEALAVDPQSYEREILSFLNQLPLQNEKVSENRHGG